MNDIQVNWTSWNKDLAKELAKWDTLVVIEEDSFIEVEDILCVLDQLVAVKKGWA